MGVLDEIEQYLQTNSYIEKYFRVDSSSQCALFTFIVNKHVGIPVDVWNVWSNVQTRMWIKTSVKIMDITNIWDEFYKGLLEFRDKAEITFISVPEEVQYVSLYTFRTKSLLLKTGRTGVFRACDRGFFQRD